MRRLVRLALIFGALCALLPPNAIGALHKVPLRRELKVQALAAGTDGKLWAAGLKASPTAPEVFVGWFSPSGKEKAFFEPVPAGSSGIGELIRGPEGEMWFTVPGIDEVARIDAAGHEESLTMPTGSRPTGLVAARDDVWATFEGAPEIAQIEPSGPRVIEWDLRPGTSLTRVVLGADEGLWAIGADTGQVVRTNLQGGPAYVRLESGDVAKFAGTLNSDIAAGPGGTIWVSQRDRGALGKITPTSAEEGDYTRYAVPGGPTNFLSPGPGGDIWFADEAGKIGSIAEDGTVGKLRCATRGCRPVTALARGPEGGLWFAVDGLIQRFQPRGAARTQSPR